MVRHIQYLILVIFCVFAGACQSSTTSGREGLWSSVHPPQFFPQKAGPEFQKVSKIFRSSCVSCHSSSRPGGSLNLESSAAYGELVNEKSSQSPMLLVKPGDPKNSYLLHKLRGTHLQAGGRGERMPTIRGWQPSIFNPADLATLEKWVRDGASY